MRRASALLLFGVTLALAGCGDNQSVLNPKSGPATELAQLSWLLFAMGAFVMLVVLAATFLAVRGPVGARSALSSRTTVIWGGIAFPIVVLTVLLVYGVWLTGATQLRLRDAADLRIKVVGEQWWWRIAYEGRNGQPVHSANELRIPVGRATLLELTAADVIHSFWVPNLAGKIDMIPGHVNRLTVTAEQPGVYRGQCAEYCGAQHALMAFDVVAEPPERFDA
jgi:cytochrome c oxidase subunit 2